MAGGCPTQQAARRGIEFVVRELSWRSGVCGEPGQPQPQAPPQQPPPPAEGCPLLPRAELARPPTEIVESSRTVSS